jgi:F-type H+-transporting ATPase subunit a
MTMILSSSETYLDKLATMFDWSIDAPLYSSLLVMLLVLSLAIVVGIKARRADPLVAPKGLLLLAEWFTEFVEKFVKEHMGPGFERMAGYFMCLITYMFIAFCWGLTGMPSVIDWLAAPLSLALVMFLLIHLTSIRYQGWHYFHRYIDPIFIFLPVNLITMWSPIISTTFRMLGNCLAGTVIIGVLQWALSMASSALFSFMPSGLASIWLAPIPMGILNLYFGLFSAFIQTTVFVFLNAIWIAQEKPLAEETSIRTGAVLASEAK